MIMSLFGSTRMYFQTQFYHTNACLYTQIKQNTKIAGIDSNLIDTRYLNELSNGLTLHLLILYPLA